ncbi:hypothetical protein [Streptomyces macrosporus]|uniref:hypothetical protein n=1 Tax=Streptomyces macrosporus TaxID=44032 RepID=UPI0031CEF1F0
MPPDTRIFDPHGPVHAGVGAQINLTVIGGLAKDTRDRSPRDVAEDQLLWLWRRFVHPGGFGEARRLLRATGTVLLDGAPGSGRTSAARVLLYELRRDADTFHELLPNEEKPFLSPALVGNGDRMLLDLSEVEEALWAGVREELPSFTGTVRKKQAHLVVVLPHHRDQRPLEDLWRHRAEIERPREHEVLLRHLTLDDVPRNACSPSLPVLSDFLGSGRPMREIADFAARIVRARKAAPPDKGFAHWCARALADLSGPRTQVAKRLAEAGTGPQRALLLSTAMLHEAHSDVVHHGAESLLRIAGSPKDDRPLLEHEDLARRFEDISAVRDANGRVRFEEFDHDAAVRDHFWDHRPDLRGHLRTWVGHTVGFTDPSFSLEDRDRLVVRLAAQYLRTKRPEELASLAEEWTAPPVTADRLRAAAQVLKHGLNDEEHGRSFRRRVYDWSRSGQVSEGLSHVLVDLCVEVIAVHRPDEAVVRLHHLARHERRTDRACAALLLLTGADHRLLRLMLFRLARDLGRGSHPADPGLFLRIADPLPLTSPGTRPRALFAEAAVREWLATAWTAVFEQCPRQTWEPYVRRWLHTACADERHGDPLLDVLVAGARERGDLLGALYATARSGQRSAPGGRERGALLTDRLLSKISIAQGLSPSPSQSPQPPRGATS